MLGLDAVDGRRPNLRGEVAYDDPAEIERAIAKSDQRPPAPGGRPPYVSPDRGYAEWMPYQKGKPRKPNP